MEGWAGVEAVLFLWAVVHPVGVGALRPQLVHGEALTSIVLGNWRRDGSGLAGASGHVLDKR